MIAITAPKRLEGAYSDVPTWRELGANAVVSNWRIMLGPRGLAPQHASYWDSVLARVVETDEWKKMLEQDLLTSDFLRSADARNDLNAQYEELRGLLEVFGLAKQ